MISLIINNQEITVPEGTTILEAAKSLKYNIPTLCYKKELSVYGGCRLCVVEVKNRDTMPISCATVVEEGMHVFTHSAKVIEVRKNIFQLIIANHPFDCRLNCLTCIKSSSCELRKLADEIGVKDLKYEFIDKEWEKDTSSLSIEIENSKCVSCGRCVRTCLEKQHVGVLTMTDRGPSTKVSTFLNKGIGNVDCTTCGQCIVACPTGAIHEVYHLNQVISALLNPQKHVVVETAPAIRVSIGEEFGMAPGINVEGKVVTALKKIGFSGVFDTNFTADLTIVEEGYEFIKRLSENKNLPLITSCSPGWVTFAEHHCQDILDNLSTCKSPQQMFGSLAKSYYAEKKGIPPENIVTVSIMPCTAKKSELARLEFRHNHHHSHDIDYVLTTREFAKLIKAYGINFTELEDTPYDDPFGISTGAAAIFGASGGVMEAALRTAYEVITGTQLENLDFTSVRGLEGIKEANINIGGQTISVAVASGLENAYQLLKDKELYHFIEIMACPGGCIGGGGQPISCDENIFEKRKDGIYDVDKKREYRKSHENPAIKKLYSEFLGKPLGEMSHKYLHTHYNKR